MSCVLAVAEHVDGEHDEHDREGWWPQLPPVAVEQVVDAGGEQVAPAGGRGRHAEPKERHRRVDEDRVRHAERGGDDHGAGHVRHQMPEHHMIVAGAELPADLHVVAGAQAEHLAPDQPRRGLPARRGDRQDDDDQGRRGDRGQQDDEEQERDGEQGIDHAHQRRVDEPADVACGRTPDHAERGAQDGHGEADLERALAADHQLAELVPALRGRAQRVRGRRGHVGQQQVGAGFVGVVQQRAGITEQRDGDDGGQAGHRQLVFPGDGQHAGQPPGRQLLAGSERQLPPHPGARCQRAGRQLRHSAPADPSSRTRRRPAASPPRPRRSPPARRRAGPGSPGTATRPRRAGRCPGS